MFSFASAPEYSMILPGFVLLSIGGPFITMSIMSFSFLIPEKSGTVISLFIAMMDASAVDFVLVDLMYYHFNFSRKEMFLALAVIGGLIFLIALVLWPSRPFAPISADHILSFDEADEEEGLMEGCNVPDAVDVDRSGKYGKLNFTHLNFREAVCNPVFLAGIIYMSYHVFRLNLYIGTVHAQVSQLTSTAKVAADWTTVFGWILPGSQILAIPAVGWILDTQPTWKIFIILNCIGVVFGAANLIPVLEVQVITFLTDGIFNGFLFAAMSSYNIEIFGVRNFGKLWGCTYLVTGAMTFLLEPLDQFVVNQLHNNWALPNAILAAGIVLTFSFPMWLRYTQLQLSDYMKKRDSLDGRQASL